MGAAMFMSSPDLLTKQPWVRGELEACSGQDTEAGDSHVQPVLVLL